MVTARPQPDMEEALSQYRKGPLTRDFVGLAARQPDLAHERREEAARLYADGLTLAQVAAQLGISDSTVRTAVLACGGAIRPGGRRRIVGV